MTQSPTLQYKVVVILEDAKLCASELADRFRALGAAVHVVSRQTHVETLVRNKRVDVVFLGFALSGADSLRRVLDDHGVPHITCATPADLGTLATELSQLSGERLN